MPPRGRPAPTGEGKMPALQEINKVERLLSNPRCVSAGGLPENCQRPRESSLDRLRCTSPKAWTRSPEPFFAHHKVPGCSAPSLEPESCLREKAQRVRYP